MSVLIPEVDLAPSVTSRVVTIHAIDMQEGAPAGGSVEFVLPADVHVPADGVILQAGSVTIALEDGRGSVRLPCYDPDTRPDGWVILVKKSWAPYPYAIRVPMGTTSISLVDIEPIAEADPGMVQWLLTGASATISEGSPAQVSVTVAGGVANFSFTVPPGDAATMTALSQALSRPTGETASTDSGAWAIALTDNAGAVAAGVDARGRLRTTRPPLLPDGALGSDALGAGIGALDPSTGYVWGVADREGAIGVGVRINGTLDGGSSSRARLACVGDSLIAGSTNGVVWDVADSFPALMGPLLPGVTITPAGFGGATVDDVRVRLGMLPVQVGPVTIPASGPVAISTAHTPGCGPGATFYGPLGPVVGTLTHLAPGSWTFARVTDGTAAVLPAARFIAAREDLSRDTVIIWAGRNNINQQVLGPELDVVEHVVAAITDLTRWLAVHDKRYLIVSVVNRPGDEPSGSLGHAQITAINTRLRDLHPGRFVDVRSWLIHDALTALGMTPTAADTAAIAADAPPPSLMDAGSHYIKAVAPHLATMFAHALTSRGWI